MATETVTLKLIAQDLMSGNVSKAIGSLDKLAKQGGLVGAVAQGVGQSFGQMLNPIGLVTKGIGMVTDFMGDAVQGALELERQMKATEAVLKSTGGVANVTAKDVSDIASSIENYGAVSDTAVMAGENLLLTFTNIRNEVGKGNDIFTQSTKIMVDMSRALGQDMKSSAVQLGKALNDPIKGMTALQRVGVAFTEDQKALVKQLVKTGDRLGAQKVILKELNTEFGGAEAAFGETAAGKVERMNQKFGDMQRVLGKILVDSATPFLKFLDDITNQAPNVTTSLGKVTEQLRFQAERIQEARDSGFDLLKSWQDLTTDLYRAISPADAKIHDFAQSLDKRLVQALGATNQELGLFIEAGFAAGLSTDQLREKLEEIAGEAYQTADAVSQTAPLLTTAWAQMAKGAAKSGRVIYTGLVQPTKRAMRDMFQTAKDAKAPWRNVMRELAEAGKNPFDDKKFAGWMERKARKFVQNARREFRQGKGDNRRAAEALAYVMTNPILVALAETEEEIRRLANAAAVILDVQRRIGGFSRNGSTGKNPNAQIGPTGGVEARASGGPVRRGRPYIVGDGGEPELFVPDTNGTILNGRQMRALGGPTVVVNVTHIGSMSEAEGDRLAAALEKPLRRRMARAGA